MSAKNLVRRPLSLKIFLGILVIVSLQSTVLLWSSTQQFRKSATEEAEKEIRSLLISYQQNLEYLAENKAYQQIQKNITSLGVQVNIRQALLLDHRNRVIASTHIADISKSVGDFFEPSITARIESHLTNAKKHYKNIIWKSADNKFIYAITPITLGRLNKNAIRPDKIGAMLLKIDMGWVDSRAQELLSSTLLPNLSLILLAGLGLAIYFHFSINSRVKKLRDAALEFANANHSVRIPVSGKDELADLSMAFNQMAEEVQKQHETIKEREQNLLVTLNSIGDAVIATDADGNITRLNPIAEQLTGWSIDEARGKSVKTIFPIIDASTREPIENPVEKVINTGETVYLSNHTTLISRDKIEYQIADSAAPIIDNGKIQGMILVFNDVTEKYQLREAVRQHQKTIQDVLDGMQSLVGILNAEGEFLFTNKPSIALSGLSYDDIIGARFWELAPFCGDRDIQQQVIDDFNTALQGTTTHRDIPLHTPEGPFWIELSIHPVFDEEQHVSQLIIEGHDINRRRKMEAEIRSYSQHMQLYREQSPLATIEWNTDFEIIGWNQAAEKIFGYSFDEVKGHTTEILLPEGDSVDVQEIWDYLLQHHDVSSSINENRAKDGSTILCEWHTSLLRDNSGEVIGAASIVQDITSEQQAIESLKQKEQEQREILNSMVDGVITIDDKGTVLSFNKSAESLFGYSADEIIGKNVKTLMPEPDTSRHDQYLKNFLKTGEAHIIGQAREVIALHKEGKTFPIRLMVAELSAKADGKRRFIASCHDLSQLKHQEEVIHRTRKMDALGKLTGGIAHDYNNMLGVILGYAEILKMSLDEEHPKLAAYAQQIYTAGERGAKLTQKLLAFSRKKSMDTRKLNINHLVEESRHMLEKTLTARINLAFDLDEDIWPVKIDKNDLEDAILNISINAMHSIDSIGQLTIKTCNKHIGEADAQKLGLHAGDYVLLSLTDTGHGMNEETVQQIFDPFFTTKGDQGTGLGLSQVYGFVERSGGTIKVYSEPNHGTQFIIYFPRYMEAEQTSTRKKDKQTESQQGNERILIVDDEPALLGLTEHILSQQGYHTYTAHSAEEALAILEKEKIDLLLSDVIMPEMDGYELATIVEEKYPHIKIQLASGFSDDRHIKVSDNILHKNLLHKPYNSQDLLSRIRQLLDE